MWHVSSSWPYFHDCPLAQYQSIPSSSIQKVTDWTPRIFPNVPESPSKYASLHDMNTLDLLKAVFKWLSKEITRLQLQCLMIGLKISRLFFNQYEAKPPFARISHAFRKLHVCSRNFDWFIALPTPVVIGRSYYFGLGFSTIIWKPLHWWRVQNCTQFSCLHKRNSVSQRRLPAAADVWTFCYK